ncbi:MAG: nucleotidyl transferase AbiEii/AbiGii toxin family protein [Smithellaceae bacterium]
MKLIEIENWIRSAPDDTAKAFRQAVHVILLAISKSPELKSKMIFHGALLLTLNYSGVRYTKDIDFATANKRADIDEDTFLKEMQKSLMESSESLSYGLACKIQGSRIKPRGEGKNHQTLEINIGYAYKGGRDHQHLLRNNCTNVIKLDYSYNEINQDIEVLELIEGTNIQAYSLSDFVAEKYRALIQQKTRNRIRRQDAFDIYWLIKNNHLEGSDVKNKILISLNIKSDSKGVVVDQYILRDEDIIRRSQADYDSLAQEIEVELPPFKDMYKIVQDYYESLPWK